MSSSPGQDDLSVRDALHALGPLLPQLARRLRDHAERRASAEQNRHQALSARHATALGLLVHHDLSVSELAQQLRLSLPTVSGVVADLDRAGIVSRNPDPADRRRTIVSLRPQRRRQVEQRLADGTAPIVAALEQLTPAERAAWVKATVLLVEHLTDDAP